MTVLGFWLVVLAFLASAASAFFYSRTAAGYPMVKAARRGLLLGGGAVILASIFLLVLLLRHDYTNGYVFSYSSTSLPLHFLISSFYAGQEGSFLFWVLCSVLFAFALSRHGRRHGYEAPVMAVFMAVQSAFLVLLISKSPFRMVWEMFPQFPAGQTPADGRGLNPLLQNFWMVAHPPVLFLGFAAMGVPFSIALAGLWKKEFGWLGGAGFPWLIGSMLLLGIGIMLGAYWAYGVLGWGGYWGWDPVENASLVPWLTGVALIHTVIAHRKSGAFLRTNAALALVSFFLVVYSTFLTRSGVLGDASVHSFADPGATVYVLLVGFLALIAAAGTGLMFLRRRELAAASRSARGTSREMMLGYGALALILAAAVVLFGTSLPIFSRRAVEPAFYDTTTLPIAIVMGLLIGTSLYTTWGLGDLRAMLLRSLRAGGAAVLLTAALVWAEIRDPAMIAFVFASLFTIAVNLETAWKTRALGLPALGGKFAHAGLAVFFLGVVATGKHTASRDLSLPQHTPVDALGYTFTYTGNRMLPDGKYAFDVLVERRGEQIALAPVMFDAGDQGIMRNPDIEESLLRDIYVSPVSLTGAEHMHGEAYTLPKGEEVAIGRVTARFVRFDMSPHGDQAPTGGMVIGSVIELALEDERETVTPVSVFGPGGNPEYRPVASRLLGAPVRLLAMHVGMGEGPSTVQVEVERPHDHAPEAERLVVEASVKPFVSLLWIGTAAMFGGFILSIVRRLKEAS